MPSVISRSVSDQFELCLVKCRTFSGVGRHLNLLKVGTRNYSYSAAFTTECELRILSGLQISTFALGS